MREAYGILMPAYRPEPVMVEYLKKLRDQWDGLILLIDDGSGPDYREQFQAAERLGAVVCRQEKNRGKGAAIKLGLTWCQEHRPELSGVVTVDCDGQHSLEDVEKVLAAMDRNPGSLILGCRSFGEGTPVRSQIGNRMTSAAMRIFYGISLEDTQTGLRGLPASWFPGLLSLSGERYEYELNMLIAARREGIPMATVPIRTVYFNENEGSHYRTVRDSLRIMQAICRGLIQYGLSSALSALVDVSIYAVLVKFVFVGALLSERIFLAAVIGRILSSVVNYNCNRQLPYVQNRRLFPTFVRYYTLWSIQLFSSFGLVWLGCRYLGIDELTAKLAADLLLAAVSYQVQLHWVFREQEEGEGILRKRRERA